MKAVALPVTPIRHNRTLLWDQATNRGAVVDPGHGPTSTFRHARQTNPFRCHFVEI